MSINSCTIDCSTIDAICSSRRQIIIDDLLGTTTFSKAHQQHVNPATTINLNIFRRNPDREEENVVDVDTLEWPQIAVTINMAGQEFTQVIERGDEQFSPMLNVYGISVKNSKIEESVNISNIVIRIV
jgi:hypothetical protein